MDSYFTIKEQSSGSYRESGSRFISFAFPVKNESEIKSLLDRYKKEYHDASHLCFAYLLSGTPPVFKSHDAGEPKHSAGDPILNQIRSRDLMNILVVVIRYFGGTKLGISGLVNAYKTATLSALENAVIIEQYATDEIILKFNPAVTGEVMKILAKYKSWIPDQKFTGSSGIRLNVLQSKSGELKEYLSQVNDISLQ
jgi:uncharacterized YigZ family protein